MRIIDGSSDVCSSDLGGKVWIAVPPISDDLAVDQAGREIQRGNVANERREFVGPVEAAPCIDAHVRSGGGDRGAIARLFVLMEPAVADRHVIDGGRKLERGALGRFARRRGGGGLRDLT